MLFEGLVSLAVELSFARDRHSERPSLIAPASRNREFRPATKRVHVFFNKINISE